MYSHFFLGPKAKTWRRTTLSPPLFVQWADHPGGLTVGHPPKGNSIPSILTERRIAPNKKWILEVYTGNCRTRLIATSSIIHEAVVSYETILLCVLWHKYIEEPPLLLFCKPLGYDGAYNHAA